MFAANMHFYFADRSQSVDDCDDFPSGSPILAKASEQGTLICFYFTNTVVKKFIYKKYSLLSLASQSNSSYFSTQFKSLLMRFTALGDFPGIHLVLESMTAALALQLLYPNDPIHLEGSTTERNLLLQEVS